MIKESVGNNLKNNISDILKVKLLFSKVGAKLDDVHSPYIDASLDKAIKKFQKDRNLKIDGKISPNGETIQELQKLSAKSPTYRCPKCGAPHGGSQGGFCPECTIKM